MLRVVHCFRMQNVATEYRLHVIRACCLHWLPYIQRLLYVHCEREVDAHVLGVRLVRETGPET